MKRLERVGHIVTVGVYIGILLGLLLDTAQREMGQPIIYQAEIAHAEEIEPKEVLIERKIEWDTARIKQEVDTQAAKYGVDPKVLHTIVNCESGYYPKALGDGGKSRGLVQIHADYHDVTDEEAYDPVFALDFLAKHVSEGNAKLWSCYRIHYK